MGRNRRFGRNEDQRHSMTPSERIGSRGEEAQTNANNASTPEERRMYQSQADACKREVHRKSGQ